MNPRRTITTGLTVGLLGLTSLLSGCSPQHTAAQGPGDHAGKSLTVYAAASLVGAFDDLGADFAQAHPGVDVRPMVFDGSSTLATQISEGAPADVFASADERTAQGIADALNGTPRVFATNVLEIAVPPSNPAHITGLSDLANDNVTVVLCATEVPCGHASHELFDHADLTVHPASEEQNVTAVLTKIEAGEADAGLVYATDVMSAGDRVTGIPLADAQKAANTYVIAPVHGTANATVAQEFVDYVCSEAGQKTLASYGFSPGEAAAS